MNKADEIFENFTAKTFPKLMNCNKPKIPKAHKSLSRLITLANTPRHIIFTLLKTEGEENISKAARERTYFYMLKTTYTIQQPLKNDIKAGE